VSRRALIRIANQEGDSQAVAEHARFLGDAVFPEDEGEPTP
jgi:hypothetical protein